MRSAMAAAVRGGLGTPSAPDALDREARRRLALPVEKVLPDLEVVRLGMDRHEVARVPRRLVRGEQDRESANRIEVQVLRRHGGEHAIVAELHVAFLHLEQEVVDVPPLAEHAIGGVGPDARPEVLVVRVLGPPLRLAVGVADPARLLGIGELEGVVEPGAHEPQQVPEALGAELVALGALERKLEDVPAGRRKVVAELLPGGPIQKAGALLRRGAPRPPQPLQRLAAQAGSSARLLVARHAHSDGTP